MKIQHLATLAIASAISLVLVNAGLGNASNTTIGSHNSSVVSQNPCASKNNPCASKNNPCASKSSAKKGAKHPEFYTENGVALDGQDVVAYFAQKKPAQGNKNFTHKWKGTTWQFTSKKNRDLFAQNPVKYAPQYGGYCAKAASDGYLATTVPSAWKVVNNKLYLNYSAEAQEEWLEDVPGKIAKANKNWTGILSNDTLYR